MNGACPSALFSGMDKQIFKCTVEGQSVNFIMTGDLGNLRAGDEASAKLSPSCD